MSFGGIAGSVSRRRGDHHIGAAHFAKWELHEVIFTDAGQAHHRGQRRQEADARNYERLYLKETNLG
jgi:hypothetical protein